MIRRTLLPGWDRFERLFDFRQLIEPLDRPDGGRAAHR